MAVSDRRLNVFRRWSVAIALGVSLLLAAILIVYLFAGAGAPTAAQPLRDIAVLVDPTGIETIASVSSTQALGRFKPVKGDFSAGFTRHVHWLRFTVQAPAPGPRWLEVQPAVLDDLRLFEPSADGFVEHHTGDRQPFAKRDLNNRNFVFKLELPDSAPRSFYLRIETSSSSQVRLALWQPDDFREQDSLNMAGLGFYFGLAALLLSINVLLWAKSREALFACLSLHVLAHAAVYFGVYGLASQFIGRDQALGGDFWSSAGLALYLSSAAPVYQRMLRVDVSASWVRVLFLIQIALPWLLVPTYFSGYSLEATRLVVGCTTMFIPLLLLPSWHMWRQGQAEARWLLLANAVTLGGSGLHGLGMLGFIPTLQLSYNLHMYTSVGSMLAMQLALAMRFTAFRDEKDQARSRVEQAEQNTAIVEQAQEELQHRHVENSALLIEGERNQVRLRESLTDLQHAHQLGRIGTLEVDSSSRRTVYSELTSQIFGLPAQRQARTREEREQYYVPESWQRLQAAVDVVFADFKPFVLDLELLPAPGAARWIEVRGAAEFGESGLVVRLVGTVQDITERYLLQQATAASIAAGLAESMANRNRSEFLARVSHEMRTPLNAVMGFAQLLALEPAVCAIPAVVEQVGLIQSAADQLKSMIDDVLDLSRIQSGGLHLVSEVCSVGPLAAECLSWLAAVAMARQVSLYLNDQHHGLRAVADHRRLRQILINLLSNAVKYNRIGGSVWLSLSHEPGSDASAAGWICMAVSDTGPGLTQGQIDSLYQPFNRLGAELSEVEGTGLGLSVARELTEAMGGSLQVRSEPGKGSVFTLRLVAASPPVPDGDASLADGPVFGVASDVEPAETVQVELSRCPPRPFVVLYAEDNRLNVMVMRHAIKRLAGVRLEVAIDGGMGLALAQRLRPDLLLLDMNMPVLSGTEVMLRVRADPALATLTCVAVSANSLPEDIERAMSAGFDDYITKPFAVARVLDLVDRLRRGAGPNPGPERGISVA